jgi:hypothetical protein
MPYKGLNYTMVHGKQNKTYRDINVVYFKNDAEHKNPMCGPNVTFFNVAAGGVSIQHCVLSCGSRRLYQAGNENLSTKGKFTGM